MGLLISPTEPAELRALGDVSSAPEVYGADFLVIEGGKVCGVQRKTIIDLIASLNDGRLHEDVLKLQILPVRVLVIEGPVEVDSRHVKVGRREFGRTSWWGLMLSVQQRGIWVVNTDSLNETATFLHHLGTWVEKDKHTSLDTRPGPAGPWGHARNMDWALHLLQGFAGMGPESAKSIYRHFGGVPLRWTVGEKDLTRVPGVGKTRARQWLAALPEPEEMEGLGETAS